MRELEAAAFFQVLVCRFCCCCCCCCGCCAVVVAVVAVVVVVVDLLVGCCLNCIVQLVGIQMSCVSIRALTSNSRALMHIDLS